jgi:hypothetical protein
MCSQGGVQVPTGGKGDALPSPRATGSVGIPMGWLAGRGQQIRCNSEADGNSPDERERFQRLTNIVSRKDVFEKYCGTLQGDAKDTFFGCTPVPHALILVIINEDNHESDVPPKTQQ